MRRNLDRTSSEPFLKISTPRAGSQTRVDLPGGVVISGEGGPTEEDSAVSFDADLARAGTVRIDSVSGDNTRSLTGDDVPERRCGVWTGEYIGDITGSAWLLGGECERGEISTRGERIRGGESDGTGRDKGRMGCNSPYEERLEVFRDKVVILGEEVWVGCSAGCVFGVACTPWLRRSGSSVCMPRPRYFPLYVNKLPCGVAVPDPALERCLECLGGPASSLSSSSSPSMLVSSSFGCHGLNFSFSCCLHSSFWNKRESRGAFWSGRASFEAYFRMLGSTSHAFLYANEMGMLMGGVPYPGEEGEPGRSPPKKMTGLATFCTKKSPGGGASVDGNTLPGTTRGFSSHGKIGATFERSGDGEVSRPAVDPMTLR